MGQVLHRSATMTEAVRRAIQHSQESMSRLSARYGINPKTVCQVEEAGIYAGRADGAKQAPIHKWSDLHGLCGRLSTAVSAKTR